MKLRHTKTQIPEMNRFSIWGQETKEDIQKQIPLKNPVFRLLAAVNEASWEIFPSTVSIALFFYFCIDFKLKRSRYFVFSARQLNLAQNRIYSTFTVRTITRNEVSEQKQIKKKTVDTEYWHWYSTDLCIFRPCGVRRVLRRFNFYSYFICWFVFISHLYAEGTLPCLSCLLFFYPANKNK